MNKNELISTEIIAVRIFTIRSIQVMVDRDLSELYGVDTKRLNEQVKRNIVRFPDRFRFQLTQVEKTELVANCDRFEKLKHSTSLPYVFTEQGVSMLSAVLKSETAVQMSIQIIDAFVGMRKFIANNGLILQRLDIMERKQFETDSKFEQVFQAIEAKDIKPSEGIFFDGQVYDAYRFVSDLIKTAKKSIVLIDNYVDDSVLTLLTKRVKGCSAMIYTHKISKQLELDLQKHNEQYPLIEIKILKKSHDRFFILDNIELYHIGASLKDLGKKWFAFSKFESSEVLDNIRGMV